MALQQGYVPGGSVDGLGGSVGERDDLPAEQGDRLQGEFRIHAAVALHHTDLVDGEDTPTINEHLTEDQHARLAAELAELEGPKWAEVVQAIKAARAHGDLAENFEYHAAKNEQALLERRIRILRDRLDSAVIVDSSESEVVTVGSRVLVKDEAGESSELEISSLGGEGTVSPASPLGAVLLGRRVGETVEVPAPRGVWKATVIEIRPA